MTRLNPPITTVTYSGTTGTTLHDGKYYVDFALDKSKTVLSLLPKAYGNPNVTASIPYGDPSVARVFASFASRAVTLTVTYLG